MRTARLFFVGLLLCLFITDSAGAQIYTVLHHFGNPAVASDGLNPWCRLATDGFWFYGTTEKGGANAFGTAFSMRLDGSDYGKIHDFPANAGDGKIPQSSLLLDTGLLYGMTLIGGAQGFGSLFSMSRDGTGYARLHSFWDPAIPSDASSPHGALAADGDLLYGMTQGGGSSGCGAVFSIQSGGSDYRKLHNFCDPAIDHDGEEAWGAILIHEGVLYGMTRIGGAHDGGIIFSMNPDGSGYKKLHDFGDPAIADDGVNPFGSLISDGAKLYGMTAEGGSGQGGANKKGTIFSVTTDGSGYTILHNFTGSATDGGSPYGDLTFVDDTLYGMTFDGGALGAAPGYGVIFSLNLDGSDFTVVHNFAGAPDDGRAPLGSLLLSANTLYGTTMYGGSYGAAPGTGVVFSFKVPPAPTATPTSSPTPEPVPEPTAPPSSVLLIDLKPNKDSFGTTDRIVVLADVPRPITTLFYPVFYFELPSREKLYITQGRKGVTLTTTPSAYIQKKRKKKYLPVPITVPSPLQGISLFNAAFQGIPPGDYYLYGGAVSAAEPLRGGDLNWLPNGLDKDGFRSRAVFGR
ncbi:MAG: hypothetical protein NTZ78_01295 [Candidatus Aureabacteria bacterium]|nr:hypothetical protein [Candidatus Auribacterota bacterium]